MIDVEKIAKEIRDDAEINLRKLAFAADVENVLTPMLGEKWTFTYAVWSKILLIVWSSTDGSKASVNDMMLATSVIETRWPGSKRYTGAYAGGGEGVFTVWRQFMIKDGELDLEIHVQGKNVQNCEVKFSERMSKITDVKVGAACLGLPDLEPNSDPS